MRRLCAAVIGATMLLASMATSAPTASAEPAVGRTAAAQRAVEVVVARALSARGVPFVYGGGDAGGPTLGSAARSAATASVVPPAFTGPPVIGLGPQVPSAPPSTVVGFDASGLVVYAYAGVGVRLPRSSGQQYLAGAKVTPAQALPGDLIFYGPDGSDSVTLFVGNDLMVEATSPAVTVSRVRSANMAPYLVRVIG